MTPPEHAAQYRADACSEKLLGHIPGDADPDDQHDHEPDVEGIEHVIGTIGAVGQHRQHDQGNECQTENGAHVRLADPVHEVVHGLFPLQQNRHRTADAHGRSCLLQREQDADPEHDQGSYLGGGSGVILAATQASNIHHHHQGRDGKHSRADKPGGGGGESGANQTGHRTENGDQGKGANAGYILLRPFTLQSHQ